MEGVFVSVMKYRCSWPAPTVVGNVASVPWCVCFVQQLLVAY
jgi:hypothetical protein